jgi:hypothetical protein
MVALSEPVIALLGVTIGGLLSAAAALTAPWLTSTLAARQFREELGWRRLDELAALMDNAGLALEQFHWSLRRAIDALADGEDETKRWERREAAIAKAREQASSLGTRLAIRLGPANEADLVGIYDDFQARYTEVADAVDNRQTQLPDGRTVREALEDCANHDPYFMAARGQRETLEQQLVAGVRSRRR